MATKLLVSGATGFIAGHTIERLLGRGYHVVGTVRDLRDETKHAHLRGFAGAAERLSLVQADLLDNDPFTPHADVDVIMHMASPYVIDVKDPQRDLVDPAVRGTLAMLKAAALNPRVKRVVLTSSMAAITDEPDGRVLTEEDWNRKSGLKRNPYYYSKTMAENAAWDFMKRHKPPFDLVVINPFVVIGPSHTKAINTSNQLLLDVINGTYPAILALSWGFVDVRDVADAHLRAAEEGAANGRYICASDVMSMSRLVSVIARAGWADSNIPTMNLARPFGTLLMQVASFSQPAGIGSYLRSHLGGVVRFNNAKIQQDLGMSFLTPAQSVKDSLQDLVKWGHLSAPR